MTDSARNSALLDWYSRSRRELPWRDVADPWAVLVSEVMLQQTQVRRVVPAYREFLRRFPDPPTLAEADPALVIEAWGDLGYQRRALRLRTAAGQIAERGWPTTAAGLAELPGVGPYTAAAVACFAFGEPLPAVDTNLRRVLSRWRGQALDGEALQEAAAEALDVDHAPAWNQAVMDLGATLCRPARPDCGACPVQRWCADPSAYVPPRRQPAYRGSVRAARAAILRGVASGRIATTADLPDLGRAEEALAALVREGSVVVGHRGRLVVGDGSGS